MVQLGKQYKYRFQTFTTIKESVIVELTNRQAGMQASVHSSEAKQGEEGLTIMLNAITAGVLPLAAKLR